MSATYTLTLQTGEAELPGKELDRPMPYLKHCGHRHRTAAKAAACHLPDGNAATQVVAIDGKYGRPRRLTSDEMAGIS